MKFTEYFGIGSISTIVGEETYFTSANSKIENASIKDDQDNQLELKLVNDSGQNATIIVMVNKRYEEIAKALITKLFVYTKKMKGLTLDELCEQDISISVRSFGGKLMIDN